MRTFLFIFVLASTLCHAQEKKVLFIGNSYTYFWNLPQVVSALGLSTHDTLWTQQSTLGGGSLGQHWRNEKGLKSHTLLKSKKWDYVVLQDHSLRAIEHPDSLEYFMSKWISEIRDIGAKPIIYMTWSRSFDPTMIDVIAPAYETIAKKYDCLLIPIGKIWELAIQKRSDIQLFDSDKSHPSPLGTYMNACAFYSTFTGKPASGLPSRLMTVDKHGEKLYLSIVSPEDAQYCQSIVDSVLINHQNK